MGKGDRGEAVVDEVIYSEHSQQEVGTRSVPAAGVRTRGKRKSQEGGTPGWGFLPFATRGGAAAPPHAEAGAKTAGFYLLLLCIFYPPEILTNSALRYNMNT